MRARTAQQRPFDRRGSVRGVVRYLHQNDIKLPIRLHAGPRKGQLEWRPATSVSLDEERAASVMKLLDVLEDNDDVQNVWANFEVDEAVMAKLSA